jgi:acyl dehydratase
MSNEPGTAEALLAHVGRTYDGGCALVDANAVATYAEATQDEHIRYYGDGAIAPPMFHVRLMRDLLFAIMEDPALDLDMLRLVHAEHDARFLHPVRVGDVMHLRGSLTHVEQKSRGLLVEGKLLGFVDNQLAVQVRTSFYIRDQVKAPVGTGKRARPVSVEGSGPPSHVRTWKVAMDQSNKYAVASLDRNPIHLDAEVARAGGLPDVILHGLCTMAITGRTILDAVGNSDPLRLRRLALRWAQPVFNGTALSTRIWASEVDDRGARMVKFDVVDASGTQVVKLGVAEVGP